jgi:hypothetical protein
MLPVLTKRLQAIAQTEPIKYLANYLKAKKKLPSSGDIRQLIHNTWFKMYKRDRGARGADSSAFEHVFVGEISTDFKSGEKIVKGFHNWIHVYQQEVVHGGKLNYRGYKKPRVRGLNSLRHDLEEEQVRICTTRSFFTLLEWMSEVMLSLQILSFQFDWEGYLKPIGDSPIL